MQTSRPDHYATLGLDRNCTTGQIRAAYRALAKQHHPDLNGDLTDAKTLTQAINSAYEILGDPARREDYDRTCNEQADTKRPTRAIQTISHDVYLRIEDFLRGNCLNVLIKDPGNAEGQESYALTVPAGTAPGAIFKFPRADSMKGGVVRIRARILPGFRFKVRGSDLRCDLRISARRAAQGGQETVVGVTGTRLTLKIPPRVARGEVLRIKGEGLPKTRGGRGDLLVRVVYQPEVRVTRSPR
ncbi:MAG: DnaJ domain-containing protein [Verrucomicrobiota bacterium]